MEAVAIAAVMQAEQQLGFIARDVSLEKRGYDIESFVPGTGRLRFILLIGGVGPRQVLELMGQFLKKEALFWLRAPISALKPRE